MTRLFTLAVLLLFTATAYAHGPAKGTHGGPQVDAGDYHVELVVKGTVLTVYLKDKDDKPVDAKDHKGIGIFVVAGKPQRIELKSAGPNELTGTSAVALPTSLKGTVQITAPGGQTVQAKFE
jgi:hypothetical protein